MKEVRYYAGGILKWVCESLTGVSSNVFAMHRPMAGGEQMKDMVVVSLSSEIDDEGPYQEAVLRIDLIVRDKDRMISDVARLEEMCDDAIARFPMDGGRFKAWKPRVQLKGSDGEGFTVWIILARVRVNTTDRLDV